MLESRPARGPLRAVLANASLLLGGRTVTAILSLVYIALAARALGVETFGILVLIHAFAQAIGEIAKFQSWQAVLHYGTGPLAAGRRDDFQRVVRFTLLLDGSSALVGTALGIAGAFLLGPALGWPPEIVPAAALYATSIVFMVSATPLGILRLMDRFDLIAAQSAVAAIVRFAGAALAYLAGWGLTGFLVVWYLAAFAAFLVLFGAAVAEMRRAGHLRAFPLHGRDLTRDMPGIWKFVCTTNMTATLALAFTHIGTLAVGFAFGPREAALFRIARQVSEAVAKPARLLVPALYPQLATMWAAGDMAALRRLSVQVGLTAGAVASLLLAGLALAGGPALGLVLGAEFEAATGVMLFLFAATTVAIWTLPLEPVLISTGRASAAFGVRLVATFVYLAALFPLMERFGLVGAGIAALAASMLMAIGQLLAVMGGRAGARPEKPRQ